MPLINCPECKKEISDKATNCINCGYPIAPQANGGLSKSSVNTEDGKKKTSLITWIITIGIFFFVIPKACTSMYNSYSSPPQDTAQPPSTEDNNTKPEQASSGVKVLNWKMSYGEYGIKMITGAIENDTDKEYSYVQIQFNTYDKHGNQIGSTIANVNNLEPHKKWKFEAAILEENAKSAKFKGISAF